MFKVSVRDRDGGTVASLRGKHKEDDKENVKKYCEAFVQALSLMGFKAEDIDKGIVEYIDFIG